jgi:hypothetical protein
MSRPASAIYVGDVRHRRFEPVRHDFRYDLFMMYLDLEELGWVFDGRPLWSRHRPAPARFKRSDYLGDPRQPLDDAVRDEVQKQTGRRPAGPIRLLTHLRYFGYCYNPVSFYYCFDARSARVEAVLAEINNTPWNERHRYVLNTRPAERSPLRSRFPKIFHVSPFMDMNLEYDWLFTEPGRRLVVHMQNLRDGRRMFDATLSLSRREISSRSLNLALLRHPFMTLKVIAAIHFQAARLRLKGCSFFPHPSKRGHQAGREGASR